MWEPRWRSATDRMIRSIGNSVSDPEDMRELEYLEWLLQMKKGEAVDRLQRDGYSLEDIAQATGRSKSVVFNWQRRWKEQGGKPAQNPATNDATAQDDEAEQEERQ